MKISKQHCIAAKCMNNLPANTSRMLIAVCVYAICLMIIALFGIVGNSDEQALRIAQIHFSSEIISQGRVHFIWGVVPSLFSRLAKLAALVFLIYKHRLIISFLENNIQRKSIRLIIMVCLTLILLQLISFPFAFVSDFLRKRMFGLLASDFSLWVFRYAISVAVRLIISVALILFFIWTATRFARYYAVFPAAVLALTLAGILIYPRAIIPLTHSAQPLENSTLASNIVQMLARAHMPVRGIYVLDESKYSKHVNAFFTGWGPYREIYLFDTLIRNYREEEIMAIVAHELCHYREEHVLISTILGAIGLCAAVILLNQICIILFRHTLAMAAQNMKIAHILFIFSMIMFMAQPIKNSLSREMERRCDFYACELVGNREIFVEMEKKIAIANRNDVLPHPLYQFWFGTHPTAIERIESARSMR